MDYTTEVHDIYCKQIHEKWAQDLLYKLISQITQICKNRTDVKVTLCIGLVRHTIGKSDANQVTITLSERDGMVPVWTKESVGLKTKEMLTTIGTEVISAVRGFWGDIVSMVKSVLPALTHDTAKAIKNS